MIYLKICFLYVPTITHLYSTLSILVALIGLFNVYLMTAFLDCTCESVYHFAD